ncbi:uncharacterized protein LOC118183455 [Stegodyphus dumicola]|uniref:uncharacterized protein LOC118183455 n=1 Tax=Stegodyphus dumicola TaxID=202533 RepID=UPI0015AE4C84|nr:uncharacterized protein LOC118183455 [Stegodyphus dumicola]
MSVFSLNQLGVKWEKIMIEKLLHQMCPNEDFDPETKEVLERAAVDVFNTVLIKSCEFVKCSRSDSKVLKGEDLLFFLRQNCGIDPKEFSFLDYYYPHSPPYGKTMMPVKVIEKQFLKRKGNVICKLPRSEKKNVKSTEVNKLTKNKVKNVTTYKVDKVNNRSKNRVKSVTKNKVKKVAKNMVNRMTRSKKISFHTNANYSEDKCSKIIRKSLSKKTANTLTQANSCVSFQEKSQENFKKAESFGNYSIMRKVELSSSQVSSSEIPRHHASSSKQNEFLISGDRSPKRQLLSSSFDNACNFIPEIKAPQTFKENEFFMYKGKPSKKQPSSSNSTFNSVPEAVIVSGAKGNKLSTNRVKKVMKNEAEKVTKDEAKKRKNINVNKVVNNKKISFLVQNDGNSSEAKNSKMIINKNLENFGSHSVIQKAGLCKYQVSSSDISFHLSFGSNENEFLTSGGHSSERQHPSLSLDGTYNVFPETSRTLKENESIMCKSKPSKKLPSCFSNSAFNSVCEAVIESSSKGNKINCETPPSRRQYPIFNPCTTSSYESTPSRSSRADM